MDLGLLYEFDVPQSWKGERPWGQRMEEVASAIVFLLSTWRNISPARHCWWTWWVPSRVARVWQEGYAHGSGAQGVVFRAVF
jgi:hypothetical protein